MISGSKSEWRLVLFVLLLVSVLILVCSSAPALPIWVALGTSGVGLFGVVALRWPETFLAASIFMPQWKSSWPLSRITFVDLTLVTLAGLFVGLLWKVLKQFSGLERRNLADSFRGQWKILAAYGAFCATVALSLAYTDSPTYGSAKLLRLVLIGTLLLVSGLILMRDEADFRRFALLFVLCGCVTSVQMVLHLQIRAANAEGDITRIGAGWLLGMSILLLLCFPLLQNIRGRSLLILVCAAILVAGLVASAARGPAVSLALVLPLTFFAFAKQKLSSSSVLAGVLLLVTCSGSYLYLRQADPEKFSSKAGELLQLSEGGKASGSGAKRLEFYLRTLSAIPDHLWLGQGVGSWSFFYYGRDVRGYPHNLFLETTFEEGLVGQFLMLIFLVLVTSAAYRLSRISRGLYGVLPGLLLYCVLVSMFSGDLDDNRIIWVWCGVTMAVWRNAREQGFLHIGTTARRVPSYANSVSLQRASVES